MPDATVTINADTPAIQKLAVDLARQAVIAELEQLATVLEARGAERDQIGDDDGDQCDGECDHADCHTVSAVATWWRSGSLLRRRAAELRAGDETVPAAADAVGGDHA